MAATRALRACRPAQQVLFDSSAAGPGGDYHDTLVVLTDAGRVEVPLRALAPRPRLRLLPAAPPLCEDSSDSGAGAHAAAGLLEFGLVPAGAAQARTVRLVNEGARPAEWKAAVDG
jgi:hypothetical protein